MIAEQAATIRHQLAYCVRDDLALIRVFGADALTFLHRVMTADVRRLAVGQSAPSALLTQKGGVVFVADICRGEDDLLLVVARAQRLLVEQSLARYAVMDDVEFVQLERELIGVYGAALPDRWSAAADQWARQRELAPGWTAEVVADDSLGTLGSLIAVDPAQAARLVEQLVADGAAEVGLDAVEVCRVEAGSPGAAEFADGAFLLELGQLGRVSFEKGCYIGQEPVCRAYNRGGVQRRLVALAFAGEAPEAGASLSAPGKQDAGRVTSVAASPTYGLIGLGVVHRSVLGELLRFGEQTEARVVELPRQADGAPRLALPRCAPRYREQAC